ELAVPLRRGASRHSQSEEVAVARRIPGAREIGQQRGPLLQQFLYQVRLARAHVANGRCIIHGACGDETIDTIERNRKPALREQREQITAPSARGSRDGGQTVLLLAARRVGAVVEQ